MWIRIRMWYGTYKNTCSVRTLKSLINNMFIGVHEVSYSPKTTATSHHIMAVSGVRCNLFSSRQFNK